MSDRTVIENRAVANIDESGAKYASGHLVAEPLLANGEPVMDGGAHRTADEREIAREIAGASEWPIKKSRKLGAES